MKRGDERTAEAKGDDSGDVRKGLIVSAVYGIVGLALGFGALLAGGVPRLVLGIPAILILIVSLWCFLIWGSASAVMRHMPQIEKALARNHPDPAPDSFGESNLNVAMMQEACSFTYDDALQWTHDHPIDESKFGDVQRDARRLPDGALPAMGEVLGKGTETEAASALAALMSKGVTVDVLERDDGSITYRMTMPDGTFLIRKNIMEADE